MNYTYVNYMYVVKSDKTIMIKLTPKVVAQLTVSWEDVIIKLKNDGQLTGFRIRAHVSVSTIIILARQNIQKQTLISRSRVQHSGGVCVVVWDVSSVKSRFLTTITFINSPSSTNDLWVAAKTQSSYIKIKRTMSFFAALENYCTRSQLNTSFDSEMIRF